MTTLSPSPVRLGAMALISVAEAARRHGLSVRRIREVLTKGTVRGVKFGKTWAVEEESLEAYMNSPRKRGPRPKRG